MTTSAPPPRDPELAADPDYRQAAAEDWWGRVADYYADQQAEADQEALCLAAQGGSGRPPGLPGAVRRPDPRPRAGAPPPRRAPAPPRSSSTAALEAAEPTEPEAGP